MLPTGRLSGVLLPLFSLRGKSDFGIGDFGCTEGFFRWMHAARQKLWMMLPLLPTAPGDSSPYATRSAFGLNPLFIHLNDLPEWEDAGGLNALSTEERQKLEAAQESPAIRYDWVFPLKTAAFRRSFSRFHEKQWKEQSERARAFKRYQEAQRGWLDDFALYTALSEREHRRGFWEWPEGVRNRQPAALEEARRELLPEILFHSWLQFVAEEQWEAVRKQAREYGILLCGDEPFIVGQDSADCWAYPHLLRRDARLGVPPDDFSATGQDWGLPYFDFDAMEKEGYAWIRRRAQKSAAYYDLRRVDHAVGYFRQWIRDESTPLGRFVPPSDASHRPLGEKMFQLLLEPGAGVVAEDLGVVPAFVREALTSLGIPGYRVMRWEKDFNVYRNPHQYPALSLVTTGTHDTETLKEWWEAMSQDERNAAGHAFEELRPVPHQTGEFTEEIHQALLLAAERSGSNICVLPWQDILGSAERINLPGSMGPTNWAYRVAQRSEDMLADDETRQAAARLAEMSEKSGR